MLVQGEAPSLTTSYLYGMIDQLKKQSEANDTEGMKATMKSLEEDLMKIGQAVYAQQQAQGGAAGQGAAPGAQQQAKDGDVVDAEVVDEGK